MVIAFTFALVSLGIFFPPFSRHSWWEYTGIGRNEQERENGKTPGFPGVLRTLLELFGLKDGGAEGSRTPDLDIA
ncbi:MAG: hypothetical protein OXP07_11980, partial [Defluviicoccus sp.]|nr:hypothetical protein [Defluviicoccus sp.]